MTPPRSSSGTPISSAQSSPQGNGMLSPSSMSVTGSDHATHSKDNREGMYRRGVVRMQAVSAAVETLEKFAKLTRVGRSLTKARGASSGESDAGVSGVGSSPATASKQVDNANPSTLPQLSDLREPGLQLPLQATLRGSPGLAVSPCRPAQARLHIVDPAWLCPPVDLTDKI